MLRANPRPGRPILGGLILALTLCAALPAAAAEKAPMKGVGDFEIPDWFKVSFLDLRADVEEAAAADKRLMVFFYQEGCPYCDKLINYNFSQKPVVEYTREHFDVVALNMWGDRQVTDLEGNTVSEKQLAERLKVWFTPTLLFFDEDSEVVLRVNGYYPPSRFMTALEYVASKKEDELAFAAYRKDHAQPAAAGQLHEQPFFSSPPHDLASASGPVAVFFEQPDCPKCDELHKEVLAEAKTRELLEPFHAVQLNRWSDTPVVTPAGERTSAKAWADALGVGYVPTAVLFDEGKEVIRLEAYFKTFHTQSALDFVASNAYRDYTNFQRYVHDRSDRLREQGTTVDLWE